jgi:hypothetical protein
VRKKKAKQKKKQKEKQIKERKNQALMARMCAALSEWLVG